MSGKSVPLDLEKTEARIAKSRRTFRYKYWHRPKNWLSLKWYLFSSWAWHRYTTVTPRYIGHTWHEPDELIPHLMFTVLSDFFEQGELPAYESLLKDSPPYDYSPVFKSYADDIAEYEAKIKKYQEELATVGLDEEKKKDIEGEIWMEEMALHGVKQSDEQFRAVSSLYAWYHSQYIPLWKAQTENGSSSWSDLELEQQWYEKMQEQLKKIIDHLPSMWT